MPIMESHRPSPQSSALQRQAFLLLMVLVTCAMVWILWPYHGALMWGAIVALLFAPMNRWLLKRLRRPNLAALITLFAVLLIVVLPMVFLLGSLAREATLIYNQMQSGEFSVGGWMNSVYQALPGWLTSLMGRFGITDLPSVQAKLTDALRQASQLIASQALNFGQNTLEIVIAFFIAVYIAFFLIKDGAVLSVSLRRAIPLEEHHKRRLLEKFATVIRATVKGNLVVALAQGALGGIAFWVLDIRGATLWAALMAILSLLPAVGAGLVWMPVALWLLATGATGAGVGLIAYGVLVIGLADNVLRPILVGKDTKMPDWVVLISTIGGIAIFGINGFVIGPVIAAMFIAVWSIFAREGADDGDPVSEAGAAAPRPPVPVSVARAAAEDRAAPPRPDRAPPRQG